MANQGFAQAALPFSAETYDGWKERIRKRRQDEEGWEADTGVKGRTPGVRL